MDISRPVYNLLRDEYRQELFELQNTERLIFGFGGFEYDPHSVCVQDVGAFDDALLRFIISEVRRFFCLFNADSKLFTEMQRAGHNAKEIAAAIIGDSVGQEALG